MAIIDKTASVIDCTIADTASVYRYVNLRNTILDEYSAIVDFSKIDDSKLGKFTRIYANGLMYGSNMGDYSYAQKNASIWYAEIGKYCSISWNSSIGGGEHDFERVTSHSLLYAPSYGFTDKPLYERFINPCVIGNDVWLGAGVHILRGVTVGDGAVIGAGAVVTHDVDPYSIVAGVPAKKIGQRCNDEQIADLLEIKWWDIEVNILKQHVELLNRKLDKETVEMIRDLKNLDYS